MSAVIEFKGVSKQYALGKVTKNTLKRDVQRFWDMKVMHREDPYLKVTATGAPPTGHVWALKDINLEIEEGDVVGIIGHNGAGKSTLLKILSRVTGPTIGSILVRGRIASMLEVGTGFNIELTGRENIYLSAAIHGLTKHAIESRIEKIIEFSGCREYIDTPVKRYSSGMYVRLGFAVAAYIEPDILVVDEVLAVGDAQFQSKAIGKMRDLSRSGRRTVLFVSHNMGSIKALCTKCIWLEHGTIREIGPTDEVVTHYLRSCLPDNTSPVWTPSTKTAPSRQFRIASLAVLGADGSPRQTFTCDESMIVRMSVNLEGIKSGIIGRLEFQRADDESIVWRSQTNDLEQGFELRNGVTELTVQVPPRTLGAGNYTISVSFAERGLRRYFLLDEARAALSIALHDYTTPLGDTRPGYLATLLRWDITSQPPRPA